MVRLTLRRTVIIILAVICVSWTTYIMSTRLLVSHQKSILRYQLERELEKYWGKNLEPQNGVCLCVDKNNYSVHVAY